jgi:hypothetical protein
MNKGVLKNKVISKRVLQALIGLQFLMALLFPPKNILSYDIFGYYLYLPQTFIYHDLQIKNDSTIFKILNKYHNSETFYQAAKSKYNEQYVMKYSMGMAILYSPFFAVGHSIAKLSSYEADGYSVPYQKAIFFGCLLYSILGLIYLRKILLLFFDENISSITLLSIFFATNYFAHTNLFGQNAMSHNPLFTLYTLIIYFTVQWYKNYNKKYSIGIGICIGLAALIRPTEIISVLIPLLYGIKHISDIKPRINFLIKKKKQIGIAGMIVFAIGFLQLIYFKIYAGKFIYNSYGANPGEGFEFFHPYFAEVLFSFRKGWLIYTPIAIFFIAGLFTNEFKRSGFQFAFILFFTLYLYITSSWSCWWYAGSFGQRALIPCLAVLSLPFASLVKHLSGSKLKNIFFGLLGVFSFLNLFQSWQLSKGIIDSERMSRAYYFSTFLQTKAPTEEQRELLLLDRGKTLNDNLSENDLSKLECYRSENGIYKNFVLHADSATPIIRRTYEEMSNKYFSTIKVTAFFLKPQNGGADLKLKISMEHNGYEYKLRYKTSDPNAKDSLNKIELFYLTPEVRRKTDPVKIYLENHSKVPVRVIDLKYEVYTPKEDRSVF